MTFKKIRETNYPEMKMNVQVYEHTETGALHYHTEYDTIQNSFNVAFRTLPENSNGLPHILEHSVLNGSEKFPMHGVFFAMQGRNFETYSNAMTGFDTTQYPFSTIDTQGFFNLLSVYLDAVFFPKLEKEIFLQEGWRYTFEKAEDSSTPLQYSGVVYNEMKGAYANPDRVVFVELLKQAFAHTQYENSSGGHPLEIPKLTYEDFIAFHKKFYHPSNATFYTFGSIPVSEIHEKFESLVLNRFKKEMIDNKIHTENLNISGQNYESVHPGDTGYIYMKGFRIPEFKTVEDMYEVQLLLQLLQSGKNDFTNVFLQQDIGVNSDGIGILPVSQPVIYMDFKMDDAKNVEVDTLIKNYFETILTVGIDTQELENVFDSVELDVREGEAASNNLGMSIISQYISAEKYGISIPENINDIKMFKKLREKLQNKEYFQNLIKLYFIDNKQTFNFLSKADSNFGKDLESKAQDLLQVKQNSLTQEQKEEIIEQSKRLEVVRLKEKDYSTLPKLTLTDITIDYPEDKQYTELMVGQSIIYNFVEDTKGVTYLKFNYPLQETSQDELFLQKLAIDVLDSINLKGMSLDETSLWKQSKIGHMDVNLTLIPQNKDEFSTSFMIETKGLAEHTKTLVHKSLELSKNMSFKNEDLVTGAINNLWRDHLGSYQDNAHVFAIREAESGYTSHMSFKKQMTTDYKTKFLKKVVKELENKNFTIVKKLESAYKRIFEFAPTIFFCGNEKSQKIMLNELEKNSEKLKIKGTEIFTYNISKTNKNSALDLNIPVNHIAYVLPVASADEEDSGKLRVLAAYIQPFLHTSIREKGGAYGANASYSNTGLFTLYSYRDPNSTETINIFNEIGNYILNKDIDENELNVNKLNIIKGFNKPKEEIHKAGRQFNKILKEQGTNERLIIDSVLATTKDDLKYLVKKYFIGKEPSIAIATNKTTIKEHFEDWNMQILNEQKEESINKIKI